MRGRRYLFGESTPWWHEMPEVGPLPVNFRNFPRPRTAHSAGRRAIPSSVQERLPTLRRGGSEQIVGGSKKTAEPKVTEPFDKDALIGEVRVQEDSISTVGQRLRLDRLRGADQGPAQSKSAVAGGKWIFTRTKLRG